MANEGRSESSGGLLGKLAKDRVVGEIKTVMERHGLNPEQKRDVLKTVMEELPVVSETTHRNTEMRPFGRYTKFLGL